MDWLLHVSLHFLSLLFFLRVAHRSLSLSLPLLRCIILSSFSSLSRHEQAKPSGEDFFKSAYSFVSPASRAISYHGCQFCDKCKKRRQRQRGRVKQSKRKKRSEQASHSRGERGSSKCVHITTAPKLRSRGSCKCCTPSSTPLAILESEN